MHTRKLMIIGLASILLVSWFCLNRVSAIDGNTESGAVATVENYLNALIAGDVSGIKRLLTPNLLQKKASGLDSPGYDDFLRTHYQNAVFRVVDTNPLGEDRVKVDTEIILGTDQPTEASFILVYDSSGTFLIDEEVE